MQADWDKKYLIQVRDFSHENVEWKVSHSDEDVSPHRNKS